MLQFVVVIIHNFGIFGIALWLNMMDESHRSKHNYYLPLLLRNYFMQQLAKPLYTFITQKLLYAAISVNIFTFITQKLL